MLLTHPLVMTIMVLYSIVAAIPLSTFPPVDVPTYTDLLILGVLLILLMRIVLTYRYASLVTEYTPKLFLLEVCIALLFAWQFRFIAAIKEPNVSCPLSAYYVLHIILVITMPTWRRLAGEHVPKLLKPPRFILVLQVIGVSSALAGIAFEFFDALRPHREPARWAVAGVLLSLALKYASSKPWERVKLPRDIVPDA